MEDRPQPFLGLHAINVYVRDQEESLRFYLDCLGFRLAFDASMPSGGRWVAVAPPDGSTVISLIAPSPESYEYRWIGRNTGITFVTEDVLKKFEEWRRNGVRFLLTPRLRRVHIGTPGGPEEVPVWGGTFARFVDPDGNGFSLVGFDEVNRRIEAERQAAEVRREAERRATQELKIAKQVQSRLFPQTLPAVASLEYAGECIQAREVGGDYYDFLDLGQGRFGFVIADIAGKGIAAALLMANLQANLRSQCAVAQEDPARMLRSVNRLLFENTGESAYATLFFAEYEDRTRRLRFANCGHLPALILRCDGSVERLDSTCTVVGLFAEWDCAIEERQLSPGDTLAFYTDGVTESFNEQGDEFGEQRLLEALAMHRGCPARETIAEVVADLRSFSTCEQHDDITLIVARCR